MFKPAEPTSRARLPLHQHFQLAERGGSTLRAGADGRRPGDAAPSLELGSLSYRRPQGTVWALVGHLYHPDSPICRSDYGTTARLWGSSLAASAAPRSGVTAGRLCLACCLERVDVRDALVWVSIW